MLGNAWYAHSQSLRKEISLMSGYRLILHDEKAYPDAMSFRPERFLRPDGSLNPDVQDPMLVAFGFGRRLVPSTNHMSTSFSLKNWTAFVLVGTWLWTEHLLPLHRSWPRSTSNPRLMRMENHFWRRQGWLLACCRKLYLYDIQESGRTNKPYLAILFLSSARSRQGPIKSRNWSPSHSIHQENTNSLKVPDINTMLQTLSGSLTFISSQFKKMEQFSYTRSRRRKKRYSYEVFNSSPRGTEQSVVAVFLRHSQTHYSVDGTY